MQFENPKFSRPINNTRFTNNPGQPNAPRFNLQDKTKEPFYMQQFLNQTDPRPPSRIFKDVGGHPKAPLYFFLLNQRSRAHIPEPEPAPAPTTKYEHPQVSVFNFIQKLDLTANLEAPMTTTENTDPNVDPELEAFRLSVLNHLYQILLHIPKEGLSPKWANKIPYDRFKREAVDMESELFAEADKKEDYMNLETLRRRLYYACYSPLPYNIFSYESLCEGVTIDRDGHLIDREGVRIDSDSEDDSEREEVGMVGDEMDNVLEDPRLKFIENELDLPANLEAPMSTTANTDLRLYDKCYPEGPITRTRAKKLKAKQVRVPITRARAKKLKEEA